MTPIEPNSRPARAAGVRLQLDKVSSQPVLLYPEGVLELNDTAHAILNLCNGATTVSEIVTALAAEYDVEEGVLRADALECLGDLLQRRLIVFQ
ncbi:MAG TPA: pyrroloquinoline quinone biosynthesis peptide chaperone PqqD [Candidatus Methylacidiphilales bacterium]|jgi:pyrroloquinoline quinone biosynthesis protein D|nr:pyrroloquinoline quinone biosynthesis peptide chaperone PqqD [Candidatus Methylacidiphilales bacterium]